MEGFNMRKLNRLDKLQKNVQNILVGAEHATNIFSPRGTIRRTDDIIDPQDPSQESYSWQDMAELTHATQVEKFNWCECEQQEQFPYDDCPRVVKHDYRICDCIKCEYWQEVELYHGESDE